jgi:excinuclease UvrABC nuclease subunit
MADAADQLQFERAARLRDALHSLDGLAGRQQALISAVDLLDVVAACPSRRPGDLELFLFSSGRFVHQETIGRDRLSLPEMALETARSLLRRRGDDRTTPGKDVEPEVLDQIFIVSRWLRQNSAAGQHILLPREEEPSFLALRLGAWLRETAISQNTPVESRTATTSEETALLEWDSTWLAAQSTVERAG